MGRKQTRIEWTPEEEARFKAAWLDESQTAKEIAARHKRSVKAIQLHARKKGYPIKGRVLIQAGWTPERKEEARQLYIVKGHSSTQTAKIMGCSPGAIVALADRNGWNKGAMLKAMRGKRANISQPIRNRVEKKTPEAVTRETRESIREKAFQPLPFSEPRPWLERGPFMCKWPVGGEGADMLMCCRPAASNVYCPEHAAVAFTPSARKPATAPSQRRWAA